MFDHRKYRPAAQITNPQRQWPSRVIEQAPLWCAVDLRDGNQALIDPMTVTQKQRMWGLLVEMGFKHIEVGFPSASQPDFDFVRWLIEENQIPDDVTIQVLVQARDELIERTYQALDGVKQAIVHVYNSTSPVQREKVFGLDKQGIINIAVNGAKKVQSEAQRFPNTQWTFQYSPESFSSTEVDFAIEVCNAVIDVWQPTSEKPCIINLPATVECATPNVFADQVEVFCREVNQRESIIVSVHTHNDRGCGVAAAELAVMAGADRVEGTLMGNGERTGNMDLVTMAMNLYSQGIDPNLDLSRADDIIATVEACTQIQTHPRHPWFGELVYTAFSGSHQDAIKKCLAVQTPEQPWDVAYLPIDPRDLGRDYQSVIRVNSQSGKGGVAYLMEAEHGISLPRWMQIELSQQVQKASEASSAEINATQIWDIFKQDFMDDSGRYQISSYHLDHEAFAKAGEHEQLQATLHNGRDTLTVTGHGEGAIEAFCEGLHKTLGIQVDVVKYDQSAMEQGSQAKSVAFVQVNINNQKYIGAAIDQDVINASMNAILVSVNRYLAQQGGSQVA